MGRLALECPCSPFTDNIQIIDESFQFTTEPRQPRNDAAAARSVSKAEAFVNADARKALGTAWDRL
eukprot:7422824-Pyramimonas_sp.AAC.1